MVGPKRGIKAEQLLAGFEKARFEKPPLTTWVLDGFPAGHDAPAVELTGSEETTTS